MALTRTRALSGGLDAPSLDMRIKREAKLVLCCTLLHTDGLLLVAQPCCIRRERCFAYAREHSPTTPRWEHLHERPAGVPQPWAYRQRGRQCTPVVCCFVAANDWGVCMLQTVFALVKSKTGCGFQHKKGRESAQWKRRDAQLVLHVQNRHVLDPRLLEQHPDLLRRDGDGEVPRRAHVAHRHALVLGRLMHLLLRMPMPPATSTAALSPRPTQTRGLTRPTQDLAYVTTAWSETPRRRPTTERMVTGRESVRVDQV